MKANYNVTGNDRKALVAAIENLTGDKAIYMRNLQHVKGFISIIRSGEI